MLSVIYRKYLTRLLLVLLVQVYPVLASGQRRVKEIDVDFRVNVFRIDPTFGYNESHLSDILSFLDEINRDSTIRILELSFCGSASPEGSSQWNRYLAKNRLLSLERYVRDRVSIPDSIIRYDDSYIPWDQFRQLVEDLPPFPYKSEALDIIDQDRVYVDYHGRTHIDKRVADLMELDGGRVWQRLSGLFHEMRGAYAVFVTEKRLPALANRVDTLDLSCYDVPPVPLMRVPSPVSSPESFEYRHLHVSSNLLSWAALVSNLTLEFDLSRHWSFAVPVYYSSVDYFSDDKKFRTFTIRPEFRYWFRGCHSSFYAGAHFGLSYFNVADGGLYRYQDHSMETPALGGGLSAGYRLPLGRRSRWSVEFALGGGIYDLHYDRFVNVPDGFLVDSHRDVYFGLDHVSLSLSYKIDMLRLKKK